jgi:hypothetical protein
MAVLNGKLYFSWVQRFRLCIPDPASISVHSNWQMAIGQTSASPRLSRENGGRR